MLLDLLRAWPHRVGSVVLAGVVDPLPIFDRAKVLAWPAWDCGEPDVVLSLYLGSIETHHVVIEVKFGAEMSSVDDGNEQSPLETRDQLAKYQREGVRRLERAPITVLYLTHHATEPKDDMAVSRQKMHVPLHQGSAPLLVWSSWRDLSRRLQKVAHEIDDPAFLAYATGLVHVLDRAGLRRFSGTWDDDNRVAPLINHVPLWWRSSGPAERSIRPYAWPSGTPNAIPRWYTERP